MGILDRKLDAFFDVCKEHADKKLGGSIRLRGHPGSAGMTTTLGTEEGGGDIRCFNVGERTWDVLEDDDDIHVYVACDGKVSIRFSREEQIDYGMAFKVGHPREVAELFHLFVRPASYITSEEEGPYRVRKLGDIFDIYVLIPDGQTWKVVNPAALAPETPDEFRKVFYHTLTRDWDNFLAGTACEAFKFASRWPEYVRSLPSASEYLRAGYVLTPEGDMQSAVDLSVIPPSGGAIFFDMLVVPSKEDVSSMYVREILNSDTQVCKTIRKAFTSAPDLDAFMAAIKATELHLPSKYESQVRIAAEHNAIRQWLLYITERLATQRGSYHLQAEKHWHLAHALHAMVDRNDD